MASMIPFILLAVPCALCVWLWWTMSGNGGKHKAHTSRRVSVSPQRFGKIQGETSHKDYADRPVQSKSDLPRTPLYDGEPLKVTPLGDSRAVQLETTLVDRVERPPRDFVSSVQYERKPSPYMRQAGEVALAFRVGNRYYNETKNRVFECIALKGKKARLVAFACLDSVEKEWAFRELFGGAAVAELTHTDMLKFRDALIRSGISRRTVNGRLWRVKFMLGWALDEALIPAAVKAELTQVKCVKRGRSAAPERPPVRPVDDATIAATVAKMMPNTADMVRVHRLTGMRPCELCGLRWSLIDTSRTPWVYRVPPEINKNEWRGELGQPRVVCIGPKARAILERHRGDDVPFSPVRAMSEYMEARRAARVTPFYGQKKNAPAPHVPRVLGECWNTNAYTKTIRAACVRAGIVPWGSNRLRHTFGTEVRRAFGLEAARAVLGHTNGGCITDVYTFDAVADEMVRTASPAVEALG